MNTQTQEGAPDALQAHALPVADSLPAPASSAAPAIIVRRSFAADWYASGRNPGHLRTVGRALADSLGRPALAEEVIVRQRGITRAEVADEARMLLKATFSTPDWNRNDEKVDQDGWELAAFNTYPVLLLGHNYWANPFDAIVGKVSSLTKKPVLSGVAELMADEDGKGRRLFALAQFLGALTTSPGFIPLEWELIRDSADGTKEPRTRLWFHRQELLELSVPTIPANAAALAYAVKQGLITDDLKPLVIESADVPCPPLPSPSPEGARLDGADSGQDTEALSRIMGGLSQAGLLLDLHRVGRRLP